MTLTLGEFEQLVLLALVRLGADAYGVTICDDIVDRTGRDVSLGAVYKTLERLEDKGLVASRLGEPTPERGGRRKKHFRLAAAGQRALKAIHRRLRSMTEGPRRGFQAVAERRWAAGASPRIARWLITALLPDPLREPVLGDLEEQFASVVRAEPVRRLAPLLGPGASPHYPRPRRFVALPATPAGPSRPLLSGGSDMGAILRDFRLGLRVAVRSPGYAAITALTLALAIGANTLLFSIANPLLVRALPLKDAATLGWIMASNPEREIVRGQSSLPDFLEWRASLKGFSRSRPTSSAAAR